MGGNPRHRRRCILARRGVPCGGVLESALDPPTDDRSGTLSCLAAGDRRH